MSALIGIDELVYSINDVGPNSKTANKLESLLIVEDNLACICRAEAGDISHPASARLCLFANHRQLGRIYLRPANINNKPGKAQEEEEKEEEHDCDDLV